MSGKRAKGDGTVHRLPSGSWQAQVMDGYRDNGKRNIVSYTAPTRIEAMEKLRDYWMHREELRAMKDYPGLTPFAQYADEWYADYRTQVEASTYSNYRYALEQMKRQFGDRPICTIKTSDINHCINEMVGNGYSASRIGKWRSILIKIFDRAEADDVIAKNYARRAFSTTRCEAHSRMPHPRDAFTTAEVDTMMRQLPNDLLGNSIRLLLITGMRLQELLALTPEDITSDGSQVSINKAVKVVDNQPQLGVTKSARSNRTVPIAPGYRHIAVWLREHGGQAFLWCNARRDTLLYTPACVRKRYYRALEQLPNVRELPPHCCRHTYVSMLESQGVPMEVIARLTGHTDIRTTDRYLHVSAEGLTRAVSALEGILPVQDADD